MQPQPEAPTTRSTSAGKGRSRAAVVALLAALVVVLVGCGSSSKDTKKSDSDTTAAAGTASDSGDTAGDSGDSTDTGDTGGSNSDSKFCKKIKEIDDDPVLNGDSNDEFTDEEEMDALVKAMDELVKLAPASAKDDVKYLRDVFKKMAAVDNSDSDSAQMEQLQIMEEEGDKFQTASENFTKAVRDECGIDLDSDSIDSEDLDAEVDSLTSELDSIN